MGRALTVMNQNDGDVTKAYYADMNRRGPLGQLAVAIFRTLKRSNRAKEYRRGGFRGKAYDVKDWSMQEACRLLERHGARFNIVWGWKPDPSVQFDGGDSWVLYIELPTGQVSFHNKVRYPGPDFAGEWDGVLRKATDRVCKFCDSITERGTYVRQKQVEQLQLLGD